MGNLGMALAGSSMSGKKSEKDHFYPTPPEPTQSLIDYYRPVIGDQSIYEASCGDGAICRVLTANGIHYEASDLIERGHNNDLFAVKGFGQSGVNFLEITPENYTFKGFSTIQNPPFKHWAEFVYKCHELEMPFIAMFAKMTVWNAVKRLKLYRDCPPKAIHPLTWRVDFDGRGRPTMDCCWVVWGDEVPFSNEPLERPKK